MIEIGDLSDKDTLFFFFMDGLKNCKRVELERCGVETLDAVISVAELLTNFSKSKSKQPHSSRRLVRAEGRAKLQNRYAKETLF